MSDLEQHSKSSVSEHVESANSNSAISAENRFHQEVYNFATKGNDNLIIAVDRLRPLIKDAADAKHPLTNDERKDAFSRSGKILEEMVKADLPDRDKFIKSGMDTKALDDKVAQMDKKIESAKALEEAILNGDSKTLQNTVKTMNPKELTELTELVQKHFSKMNMGLEVDYCDGKLIISNSNRSDFGNKGVAISGDSQEFVNIVNGRYQFDQHFVHGNPNDVEKGLKEMGDKSLSSFLERQHQLDRNFWDNLPATQILYDTREQYQVHEHKRTSPQAQELIIEDAWKNSQKSSIR